MSETRDKRRRKDLDLFVLALVESGLATAYELKTAADLSPGATIPVLRRLLDQGLVVQGKPGSRGRMAHKITAQGRVRLKSDWRELIDEGPSGDLDADLRVALLALWAGGDRGTAAKFLREAASQGVSAPRADDARDDLAAFPSLARWYRQLRLASTTVLAKRESAAALAMAKALPRTNGGGRKRNPRKTKP